MLEFPTKKYKTIYADPPWPEHGGGKIKRGADRHYQLMSVKDIIALPVASLADPEGAHTSISGRPTTTFPPRSIVSRHGASSMSLRSHG